MNTYKIFGYNIQSNIDLGVQQTEIGQVDINIRAVTSKEYKNLEVGGRAVFRYSIDNDVEYLVVDGSEIWVHQKSDDDNLMRLYLMGSVFGLTLLMRNRFAIHGSAIAFDDGVYIFTGDSGVGKSSIARGFINRGYQILSDDVSVITTEGSLMVIPSYPSQKLWKDSLVAHNVKDIVHSQIANRTDKYNVKIGDSFCNLPKKLLGIIEIEVDDTIEVPVIRDVDTREVLRRLINNTYRYGFIQGLKLEDEHFKWVSKLINDIDYYILERPKVGQSVNQQIDLFLNEVVSR